MNEVMSNQPAEHIASGRSCTQVTHEEHAHASARGEGAEAVDGAAASLICRPVDEVEPGGGADWERPT